MVPALRTSRIVPAPRAGPRRLDLVTWQGGSGTRTSRSSASESPIDDVIGEYVQLRNAGGGNLKGLCPFHDEKSPSFNVTPARGLFYCFGCGDGGDVITLRQEIEHLDFVEAVERLAARAGIQLRYVEGGPAPGPPARPAQPGCIEAHARGRSVLRASSSRSPEAEPAREFLAERGFDRGGGHASAAASRRRAGTR